MLGQASLRRNLDLVKCWDIQEQVECNVQNWWIFFISKTLRNLYDFTKQSWGDQNSNDPFCHRRNSLRCQGRKICCKNNFLTNATFQGISIYSTSCNILQHAAPTKTSVFMLYNGVSKDLIQNQSKNLLFSLSVFMRLRGVNQRCLHLFFHEICQLR